MTLASMKNEIEQMRSLVLTLSKEISMLKQQKMQSQAPMNGTLENVVFITLYSTYDRASHFNYESTVNASPASQPTQQSGFKL